jgi:hypothetical protein
MPLALAIPITAVFPVIDQAKNTVDLPSQRIGHRYIYQRAAQVPDQQVIRTVSPISYRKALHGAV